MAYQQGVRMDRNEKWRQDDLVFTKTCSECGITVEWQHSEQSQNNQNNFHKHLYDKGWSVKSLGFLQGRGWFCELHR